MPTATRLEYVYPQTYRVSVIDGGTVSFLSEGPGDTIGFTGFRTEPVSISQEATLLDNGQFSINGGAEAKLETKLIRTMEFQALMRPDKARDIFVALREALKNIPQERRQMYGITNEQIGLPEGAP